MEAEDSVVATHQSVEQKRRGVGPTIQESIVAVMSVLCFAFSIWAITVGWNNSIFDLHAFRQTQTAISAEYIGNTGEVLRYQTPVLGRPWSIPFEFPLYQCITVGVSHVFHLRLEPAGRFVSALFFYLILIPLFCLLRDLRLSKVNALAVTALLAISPHYIYWSRTFMIESTALFFAVAYLALFSHAVKDPTLSTKQFRIVALLMSACGVMAGLVKVTTFAPFLLVVGLILVWKTWKRGRGTVTSTSNLVFLFVTSVLIPFVATICWTHFADGVKNESPMGQFLTSSALRAWNFGSLAQRLDWRNYASNGMLQSVIDNVVGNRKFVPLALLVILLASGRRLGLFLACLALYASSIALFFNLHVVHEYYVYANGMFVIVGIGLAVASSMEAGGWKSWIGVCLLGLVCTVCVQRYLHSYYLVQGTNCPGRPNAAAFVSRETKPSDVILIFGLDWSSEFPYQSHRRAIMQWTGTMPGVAPDSHLAALGASIERQGADNIAALVACDADSQLEWGGVLGRILHFQRVEEFSADGCAIYLRR